MLPFIILMKEVVEYCIESSMQNQVENFVSF